MIKFGPSGNSESFRLEGYLHTEDAAKWVKDKGLGLFEYSFGRGVNMGVEKAHSIGNAFSKEGVELSVHAPYFINLATPEEDKARNSYMYIIESAKMCKEMGGKRIIFHPAAQGKATREVAVSKTLERLNILANIICDNNLDDMIFCPETMGKLGQIGTVEEVTAFSKVAPFFIPTIDFGHINAREQGSLKTPKDYEDRISYMVNELGLEKMLNFHTHFSKIMYSAKGEVKHLTFSDTVYGPEFEPLAVALKKLKLEPHIICESAGTQAEDAVCMKNIYFNL